MRIDARCERDSSSNFAHLVLPGITLFEAGYNS